MKTNPLFVVRRGNEVPDVWVSITQEQSDTIAKLPIMQITLNDWYTTTSHAVVVADEVHTFMQDLAHDTTGKLVNVWFQGKFKLSEVKVL